MVLAHIKSTVSRTTKSPPGGPTLHRSFVAAAAAAPIGMSSRCCMHHDDRPDQRGVTTAPSGYRRGGSIYFSSVNDGISILLLVLRSPSPVVPSPDFHDAPRAFGGSASGGRCFVPKGSVVDGLNCHGTVMGRPAASLDESRDQK
jgi:hypothetical protein